MNTASPALLVTTLIAPRNGEDTPKTKSQVWSGAAPLALGHPFQWVIERTARGVRVRKVEGTPEKAQELSYERLSEGAEIAIRPLALRIRTLAIPAPAFDGAQTGRDALSLKIFHCSGNWILSSEAVQQVFSATNDGKPVFTIAPGAAESYAITVRSEELFSELDGGVARELKPGETLTFGREQLAKLVLRKGSRHWRFQFVVPFQSDFSVPGEHANDSETLWFHKALRAAVVGFGAFMVMTWLWPKSKENPQDLVPAQFTKIVMQQQPKQKAAASAAPSEAASSSNPAASKSLPKKVQDAAVVQAFRAKALTNAVNGLLKGGMTQLLAQSDFARGSQANAEARKLFDSRSDALKATGPAIGDAVNKNVNVASLGGENAGGKGVGYSKGEKAGVKGQGNAFVSMDIAGSDVAEGLTKDEVGEVIHRHMSEVRYCYESAMLRTPDIEGKLIVNFVIGAAGNVKSSEVKQSTLPDPRLDDCLIRRLTSWKFPQPKGGIDVAVSYPFIFKTLGR